MAQTLVAKAAVTIAADPSTVWDALTNPALIKQYLFGTDAESDFAPGSPIRFRGEWQGTPYEDKGTILESRPGHLLAYSYWSSFSGLEDKPENYAKVTFTLTREAAGTRLVVVQDHVGDEKSREHSEKNWGIVLDGMKKLLEAATRP
jgi:uncharacterized protein YndB with AHSA1/START domain